MTDNLRGAVAEVAMHFLSDRELAWLTQDQALALADAVIAELGLREERWKSDDPTMLRGHWTRYVTDWTHPDA